MKKILCLMLCLLIMTGCASEQETQELENEPVVEEKIEVPSFSIKICGKELTEKEMSGYELVNYEVKLVNSQGTEKSYKYTGYRITDILDALNISVDNGFITATATDGYETVYKENYILDTTLLAVLRDGEPFKEGPWLAPCSSQTNGDYLKNVSTIEIAVN